MGTVEVIHSQSQTAVGWFTFNLKGARPGSSLSQSSHHHVEHERIWVRSRPGAVFWPSIMLCEQSAYLEVLYTAASTPMLLKWNVGQVTPGVYGSIATRGSTPELQPLNV